MAAYPDCEFINPIKELQIKVPSGDDPEPVREEDGQLLCCLTPVLNRLSPFLSDSRKCKINKFFQGGIRGKHTLVLGYLAKLAVVAFNGIGRIYYPSNVL